MSSVSVLPMALLALLPLLALLNLVACDPNWEKTVIPVPLLKNGELSWDRDAVEESISELKDRKVVWIMGKFKVGKSFITDYIRNDGIVTADTLNNTIGLNVWLDDAYAIVDTEGMMQPIGENNIYFLKEFLMSMMTRASDTLVIVTDQMDIIDMEFYERFRSIYWNTNIANMYHIHNCKNLDEESLSVYRGKIQDELKLNKRLRDVTNKIKVVDHLFLPNLKGSTITAFLQRFLGKPSIDILGTDVHVRPDVDMQMYLSSVDDSLLALGLSGLNNLLRDDVAPKPIITPIKSPLFSASRLWCKENPDSFNYFLFIQTSRLNNAVVLKGNREVKVSVQFLTSEFAVKDIDLKIPAPAPLISEGEDVLKCVNTDLGYSAVKFRGVASDTPIAVCREIPDGFVNCNTSIGAADQVAELTQLATQKAKATGSIILKI